MADVGVLSLQIEANADSAVSSLNKLAGALRAVQSAVSSGFNLSGISKQLSTLSKVVNDVVSGSTFAKIEQLAASMGKLSTAANGLQTFGKIGRIKDVLEAVNPNNAAIEGMKETSVAATEQMGEGFAQVGSSIESMSDKMDGFSGAVKKAVGSTLEEFKSMEKNGTFASWMYGPRPMPNITRNELPSEEERRQMNPQWYVDPESQQWQENVRHANEVFDEMRQKVDGAKDAVNGLNASVGQLGQTQEQQKDFQYIESMVENATKADLLAMKIDSKMNSLVEGATSGKMTGDQIASQIASIQSMKEELASLQEESNKSVSHIQKIKDAFSELKKEVKGLGISKFMNKAFNIATTRAIRWLIKDITSGIKEGFDNYKGYSEKTGNQFSKELKSVNAQFATMKNSIGAAVAPALKAAIPVIQQIASAATTAINVVNQLISLLTGASSWSMAVSGVSASANAIGSASASANAMRNSLDDAAQSSKAYKNAMNDAKNATDSAKKSTKDLLADWDELNIIQSTSGGGGGGGGKNVDYSGLFKPVFDFDATVARIADFINEHLGGALGLAEKIAAAILGWKVSQAFKGVLGQLGKIVAGTALVTLGVELAYGSGFEAGMKGYFDTFDIVGAIAGALATAIGGSLITSAFGLGGGLGFAIGLTAGVVITLIGYIEGQKNAADIAKWGDLHMTQEEIREFVLKQFSFDVEAEINVLDGVIKNQQVAKKNLDNAIEQFEKSLKVAHFKVEAGADTKEAIESIKSAAESAQQTIETINQLIDTTEEGLSLTLDKITIKNGEGEDITSDIINNIKVSNGTLREYFKGIGRQISEAILEGEKDGWTDNEMQTVLDLLDSQQRIMTKKKELQAQMQLEGKIKAGFSNIIDRETAQAQLAEQQQWIQEYTSKQKEAIQELADSTYELAAMAQASAAEEYAKGNTALGDELMAASKAYIDQADAMIAGMDDAIESRLKETREKMKEGWAETLKKVYGEDFYADMQIVTEDKAHSGVLWDMLFGIESDNRRMMREAIEKGGLDEAGKLLRENLISTIEASDPNGIVSYFLNELGGNVLDLLDVETRKGLMANLATLVDSDADAAEIFMKAFGLTKEGMEKYLAQEKPDLLPETVKEIQQEAKEQIEQYQPDTTDTAKIEQPTEVVPEIVDQTQETVKTAKEQALEAMEGMTFEDDNPIEYKVPARVVPDYDTSGMSENGQAMMERIKNMIEDGYSKEAISGVMSMFPTEYSWQEFADILPQLQEMIRNAFPSDIDTSGVEDSMGSAADATSAAATSMESDINSINGLKVGGIDGSALIGSLSAMASSVWAQVNSIKSALSQLSGLSGVSVGGAFKGGLPVTASGHFAHFASGGFPNSGSLFMADENGNIEMKGKMGSQPVVANNNQIIAGISKGVASGQDEQNSLLRRQNEILSQLLNKRFTAEVRPSSSLGRTNARSGNMYDRVTG